MDIELTQYQQLLLEAAQKWAFACYESHSCKKDKWEALEQAKIEFKMLVQQAMTIEDLAHI